MSAPRYTITAVVDGEVRWFAGRTGESFGRLAGMTQWTDRLDRAEGFPSRSKAEAEARRLGKIGSEVFVEVSR